MGDVAAQVAAPLEAWPVGRIATTIIIVIIVIIIVRIIITIIAIISITIIIIILITMKIMSMPYCNVMISVIMNNDTNSKYWHLLKPGRSGRAAI